MNVRNVVEVVQACLNLGDKAKIKVKDEVVIGTLHEQFDFIF